LDLAPFVFQLVLEEFLDFLLLAGKVSHIFGASLMQNRLVPELLDTSRLLRLRFLGSFLLRREAKALSLLLLLPGWRCQVAVVREILVLRDHRDIALLLSWGRPPLFQPLSLLSKSAS